jgi:hypothetical protein
MDLTRCSTDSTRQASEMISRVPVRPRPALRWERIWLTFVSDRSNSVSGSPLGHLTADIADDVAAPDACATQLSRVPL